MATEGNLRVLLARRPRGAPVPEDFRLDEAPVPEPGEGEVLVRARWLSLDPYMRGRMDDAKSYARPVGLGEVMQGETVGEVVASRAPGFAPGDWVVGGQGWQRYSVVAPNARLMRLDPDDAPPRAALGALGMPGMTAWAGMEDIGRPRPGETVVVSAATGAVGSVVGQIARIRGARAVGIAGGPEKCRFAVEELGFAACLDHRAGDFGTALDAACPDGIDVYWENVGGAVQAAVFPRLNDHGRMVMCGMVAEYNAPRPGPNLIPAVRKRLRIQGLIVFDHWDRFPAFRAEAGGWARDGRLKWREDVAEGLERAPEAFIGLLEGRNFGKLLVRVD